MSTVRIQIRACPSCKKTFPLLDFGHACDSGPWYSAAYCRVCDRIIDGNEPHMRGMDPDHEGMWVS